LGVCALQAPHLRKHVIAQGGPVEALLGNVPAEHRRVVEVLGDMRAIDERLLGHAAADHAGAADLVLLGDSDARAISRGNAGSTHSAGAGADHEQVEVGHQTPARSISARVDGSSVSSRSSPASWRATSLPSSTPNWSNGLMPSSTALANVRCS